ncbi:MAG: hypothetical protein U0638_14180 [Phycisphaerales bacterium]
MHEADSGRWRSLNAGNGKDASLRNESTNGPSDNTFPVKEAQCEARIVAVQACRDNPRLRTCVDDIRQQLIVAALRAWPKYDPTVAAPMTFVAAVMRTEIRTEVHRRLARRQRELRANTGWSRREALRTRPFAVSDQVATAELRRAALETVPTEDREVARLILEGEGDAAIGEKIGRHRGNVHLIRKKLRALWSKFEAEWRDKWASARRYRDGALTPGEAA